MSKRHKSAYNVDKLKICYRTTSDTFGYFTKMYNLNEEAEDITQVIDRGDYSLNLIDHSSNDSEITAITISVTFEMDGQRHRLGTFDLKKEAKYCFFTFENKALYTPFIYVNGNKYNCVNFIEFITDDLGLSYNNITTLEIAKDSTRNYVTAVQKFIRDFANYEMFVNGHIVKDETATIPNYKKVYGSSRTKMSRTPSLYFGQSDGPEIKIYDKRREMAEKEQAKLSYIPQWLDFGADAPIYRAEVTVKNRDIREYMARVGVGVVGEEAMSMVTSAERLADMWRYETDRLLYFRDRTTGNIIHLADL